MLAPPFSLFFAFVWTLGAVGIFVAGLALTELMRPGAGNDLVTVGLWDAAAFGAVAAAIGHLYAGSRGSRELFGFRVTQPSLSALALALGVALHAPAETLGAVVEWLSPPSEPELLRRMAALGDLSQERAILVMVVAACLSPLMEESFFRGALFGALRENYRALPTIAVSALCFTVSHQDLRVWPAALLVAGVLGFVRHAAGSIFPCIALHVAFNSAELVPVVTGMVPAYRRPELGWPIMLSGWALCLSIVWTFHRVSGSSHEAERARGGDSGGH